VIVFDTVGATAPEPASAHDQDSVTSVLFQPFVFFVGDWPVKVIAGLVRSIMNGLLSMLAAVLPATSVHGPDGSLIMLPSCVPEETLRTPLAGKAATHELLSPDPPSVALN
jgi:hypothetical protein